MATQVMEPAPPDGGTGGNGSGSRAPALDRAPWDQVLRVSSMTLARVLAVVVACVAVAWMAGYVPRPALIAIGLGLGAVVLVVWHACRLGKDELLRLIYVVNGLALVAGVFVVLLSQASDQSRLASPYALYVGLGLALGGLAGLTELARGTYSKRKWALVAELAVIAAVGVVAWIALGSLQDDWAKLTLLASGVVLYAGLALLSGTLRSAGPDAQGTEPVGRRVLRHRYMVKAAVVIVAIFAWWLVHHAPLQAAAIPLALGFILLWYVLLALDGIVDALVVLIVLVLAWGLPPRPSDAMTTSIAEGQTVLVALGDSWISGEGASGFYPGTNVRGSNECRRASTAYAPRLVRDDGTGPDFESLIFLACSGAKTMNIDAVPQHPNEPIDGPSRLRPDGRWEAKATQLEQLDDVLRAVPREVDDDGGISRPPGELHGLVLLSLGGNDAGFGNIAATCLSLGDCADVADAWHDDLPKVEERLDRVYNAVRNEIGPSVPVLVVSYPLPLAEQSCNQSGLSSREHTALRNFGMALNQSVEQVVDQHEGFSFLDLNPAFEGHRICDRHTDEGDWYFNHLAFNPVDGTLNDRSNPRNWLHNSLHPNEKGHEAIAGAVAGWTSGHEDEITSSQFVLPTTPFRPAVVERAGARVSEGHPVGSGACVVQGPGWEGEWAACTTGHALRRYLPLALLVFLALVLVAVPVADWWTASRLREWLRTHLGRASAWTRRPLTQ